MTHARSAWWLIRRGPPGEGARILFYHRVARDRDVLAVAPDRFAAQMALVARLGLRGVDVAELGQRLAAGDDVSGLVGLSFDDGYLDVAESAAPVLERFALDAFADAHLRLYRDELAARGLPLPAP
ncbi:MAG TPA: hypothetical protein VGN06_13285 [Gaiellaceae bacterium]